MKDLRDLKDFQTEQNKHFELRAKISLAGEPSASASEQRGDTMKGVEDVCLNKAQAKAKLWP